MKPMNFLAGSLQRKRASAVSEIDFGSQRIPDESIRKGNSISLTAIISTITGKYSETIEALRIFLRQQQAEAAASARLFKILNHISGGKSEVSIVADRGVLAAHRLKQASTLCIENMHKWEARRLSIMLAAIDRFEQTIAWTQGALEHINRVEYHHYQNASLVSRHHAELLLLYAEGYRELARTDTHWQQADTLYRLLGQSSDLLVHPCGKHYEELETLNRFVQDQIDQLKLHTADSVDHEGCSSMTEVHAAAVYWTELYRLHCKLAQLIEPLYGLTSLLAELIPVEIHMCYKARNVAQQFAMALRCQKNANKACHSQLQQIYLHARDLALAAAHGYTAQYWYLERTGAGNNSEDAQNKAHCELCCHNERLRWKGD